MTVVATAYTGDTITSTGTTPKWGTIAVDPTVIPYMNSKQECINWGRRTIDIQILG